MVVNHASLLDKEDVEGIDVPTWFNFAGPNDPMINPEQREKYEKILDSKKACGYKYYPDQNHGWCVPLSPALCQEGCCLDSRAEALHTCTISVHLLGQNKATFLMEWHPRLPGAR